MKHQNYNLKKAALVYATARYSTVLINLLITAILSRLLLPSEYSIVALVTVFSTFFASISNMGIGTGIIQYKELRNEDFNDLFTLSFYISLAMGIAFSILGVPVSALYNNEIYKKVFIVLSISVFFTALNAVPDAILLRNKSFFSVGIRMIVSSIVSGIVAVILAFWGFSYYSLLIQMVMSAMCNAVWNIVSTKVRLKRKINFLPFKLILKYSSFQFAYNVINYFAQNLDNLLIPKTIGSEELAYYNKSYTLMRYPINLLPHAISPVLHPMLSGLQNKYEELYHKYLQVIKILSILGIYITVVCIFFADDLIRTLFGPNWDLAVQPFQILSLCIWSQLINAIAGSIYQSLGKTDQMFISGLIHVGVTIICTVIGAASSNLNVLSCCIMIGLNLKFLIESYFLIKKCFQKSLFSFFQYFLLDGINFILLLIVGSIVSRIAINNSMISLVAKAIITFLVYIIILIITKQMKYINILLPIKLKK